MFQLDIKFATLEMEEVIYWNFHFEKNWVIFKMTYAFVCKNNLRSFLLKIVFEKFSLESREILWSGRKYVLDRRVSLSPAPWRHPHPSVVSRIKSCSTLTNVTLLWNICFISLVHLKILRKTRKSLSCKGNFELEIRRFFFLLF